MKNPLLFDENLMGRKEREMKWLNCYKLRIVLAGLVVVLLVCDRNSKADFIFGEPTNLGAQINSSYADLPGCFSTDGLEFIICTDRPSSYGYLDLWVVSREAVTEPWVGIIHLDSRINTSGVDSLPSLSSNGLELYFNSYNRSGGHGGFDIWMAERSSPTSEWDIAVNLGNMVNSSAWDVSPVVSSDNLTLYFSSRRAGGYGSDDIWVTSRETKYDPWGPPINLGPVVNSTASECPSFISNDERLLIFNADRPGPFRSGGFGASDIWMTCRKTRFDEWEEPVNLGPNINTTSYEHRGIFCKDSLDFYFTRGNAVSDYDIWQAPIIPIVDFNGDGIVDSEDVSIMVEHWGTDNPLCDIGPMPWGDGIVDVEDLIVLAEHLFEEIPQVE